MNEPDHVPIVFSVNVSEGVYGDFTRDGNEDALFLAECFYGNHFIYSIEAWSHDGEAPRRLPALFAFSKLQGMIERFEIIDGVVRVYTFEGLAGDRWPHLNGYPVEVVTDWVFANGIWEARELSRE